MGLVFSISNFFINKIALANIWMSFSCSNLALTYQILGHITTTGGYSSPVPSGVGGVVLTEDNPGHAPLLR